MVLTQIRLSQQSKDGSLTDVKLADFYPYKDSGLVLNVAPGFVRNNNVVTEQPSIQPLTLTDDSTNYVEIDGTGVASFNTTGFTSGRIPVATVVTVSGDITTVTDNRTFLSFSTSSPTFVDSEVPSGSTDGINKDFVLAFTPITDSEHVYLNGVRQRKGGVDQENVGDFTIGSDPIFGSRRLIQTFQAGITGNIVQINLGGRVISSGTGSRVSIRDNSAQPGVEIDAFDVLDADIPPGGGKFSKTGLSIPVTSGVTYQIYITKIAGTGRQDFANDGLDTYANGTEFYDSGSGFDDTMTDLLFQTLMENAGDYTISAETISFADAPVASDSITVDYRK